MYLDRERSRPGRGGAACSEWVGGVHAGAVVHHTRGVLGRKAAYEDRRTVNAAGSCSNHALVDGGGVTTKGDLR